MVKTYDITKGNIALSKNFKLSEFQCHNLNTKILVSEELVQKLQHMRDMLGKPIKINSGYRTPAYNTKVGGAPKSQHLLGTAADIVIPGISPEMVAYYAGKVGFKGIGIYNEFTHVDVRPNEASWDLRTVK